MKAAPAEVWCVARAQRTNSMVSEHTGIQNVYGAEYILSGLRGDIIEELTLQNLRSFTIKVTGHFNHINWELGRAATSSGQLSGQDKFTSMSHARASRDVLGDWAEAKAASSFIQYHCPAEIICRSYGEHCTSRGYVLSVYSLRSLQTHCLQSFPFLRQ